MGCLSSCLRGNDDKNADNFNERSRLLDDPVSNTTARSIPPGGLNAPTAAGYGNHPKVDKQNEIIEKTAKDIIDVAAYNDPSAFDSQDVEAKSAVYQDKIERLCNTHPALLARLKPVAGAGGTTPMKKSSPLSMVGTSRTASTAALRNSIAEQQSNSMAQQKTEQMIKQCRSPPSNEHLQMAKEAADRFTKSLDNLRVKHHEDLVVDFRNS